MSIGLARKRRERAFLGIRGTPFVALRCFQRRTVLLFQREYNDHLHTVAYHTVIAYVDLLKGVFYQPALRGGHTVQQFKFLLGGFSEVPHTQVHSVDYALLVQKIRPRSYRPEDNHQHRRDEDKQPFAALLSFDFCHSDIVIHLKSRLSHHGGENVLRRFVGELRARRKLGNLVRKQLCLVGRGAVQ